MAAEIRTKHSSAKYLCNIVETPQKMYRRLSNLRSARIRKRFVVIKRFDNHALRRFDNLRYVARAVSLFQGVAKRHEGLLGICAAAPIATGRSIRIPRLPDHLCPRCW